MLPDDFARDYISRTFRAREILQRDISVIVYGPWELELDAYLRANGLAHNTRISCHYFYANALLPRCLHLHPNDPSRRHTTILFNVALIEAIVQSFWSISFGSKAPEDAIFEFMFKIVQAIAPDRYETHEASAEIILNHPLALYLKLSHEEAENVKKIRRKTLASLRREASLVDGLETNYLDVLHNQVFSLCLHFFLGHEYCHALRRFQAADNLRLVVIEDVIKKATSDIPDMSEQLLEEVVCDCMGFDNALYQANTYSIYKWVTALTLNWVRLITSTMMAIFSPDAVGAIGAISDRDRYVRRAISDPGFRKNSRLIAKKMILSGCDFFPILFSFIRRIGVLNEILAASIDAKRQVL